MPDACAPINPDVPERVRRIFGDDPAKLSTWASWCTDLIAAGYPADKAEALALSRCVTWYEPQEDVRGKLF